MLVFYIVRALYHLQTECKIIHTTLYPRARESITLVTTHRVQPFPCSDLLCTYYAKSTAVVAHLPYMGNNFFPPRSRAVAWLLGDCELSHLRVYSLYHTNSKRTQICQCWLVCAHTQDSL